MAERTATRLVAVLVAAALGCAAQAQGIERQELDPPGRPGDWSQAPDRGEGGFSGGGATDGDATDDGRTGRFRRAPRYYDHPKLPSRIEEAKTRQRTGARIRQLDKMTGATRTVEIGAGETRMVDRLSIRLAVCEAPQDGTLQGTRAFLQIRDSRSPGEDPDFSGWMFADSPALSALDHPRYDVWVISCTMPSGDVSSSSE